LSADVQNRLLATVQDTGRLLAGQPGLALDPVLSALRNLGDHMDTLHAGVHEHLWTVFRMRVALLIVVSFLERHREHFQPVDPEGVADFAH
jgi:hypothetical protein